MNQLCDKWIFYDDWLTRSLPDEDSTNCAVTQEDSQDWFDRNTGDFYDH